MGCSGKHTFVIKHLGDGQSIVQIENQKKFLLLPVEEAAPEAKLYMIADNDVVRNMNCSVWL